jgi:hypothetical protein
MTNVECSHILAEDTWSNTFFTFAKHAHGKNLYTPELSIAILVILVLYAAKISPRGVDEVSIQKLGHYSIVNAHRVSHFSS